MFGKTGKHFRAKEDLSGCKRNMRRLAAQNVPSDISESFNVISLTKTQGPYIQCLFDYNALRFKGWLNLWVS